MTDKHIDYPLFKGLQRPLEFMGIQGRYIYWAAGAVGGAILGFILGYCFLGFVTGLIALVAILGVGVARNLRRIYGKYCHYKGKWHKGIHLRRLMEYDLLFDP